jgi:hypothetical protein
MSRGSHYLLAIDPSIETAEQLNSLLRNSGISIHVLHASAAPEARRLLHEFRPLLMVYHPASEAGFPVAEAAIMARESDTPFAVRTVAAEAGALVEAMRHAPALGIDRHDDQLMVGLSKRLLHGATANEHRSSEQQGEAETQAAWTWCWPAPQRPSPTFTKVCTRLPTLPTCA